MPFFRIASSKELLFVREIVDAAKFPAQVNRLYYGDNLHVLREHIADEFVDLIYPRVQLLTIEDLLSQKRAGHPDYEPDLNFKKAKQESNAAQKEWGINEVKRKVPQIPQYG